MRKMKPDSTKTEVPSKDVKADSYSSKNYGFNEQMYRAIDNRLFKDDILPKDYNLSEKKPKTQ